MANNQIPEQIFSAIETLINANTSTFDKTEIATILEYNVDKQQYFVLTQENTKYWANRINNELYSVNDQVYVTISKDDYKLVIGKINATQNNDEILSGINSFIPSFEIFPKLDDNTTILQGPNSSVTTKISDQQRKKYNNGLYPFDHIVLYVRPQTNINSQKVKFKIGAILNLKKPMLENKRQIELSILNTEMFGNPYKFISTTGFEQYKIFSINLEEESQEEKEYIDINNIDSIIWFVDITEGQEYFTENDTLNIGAISLSFGYSASSIGENALILNYDGKESSGEFVPNTWEAPEINETTGKIDKYRKIGYNNNEAGADNKYSYLLSLEWIQGKKVYNELNLRPPVQIDKDAIAAEYAEALIKKEKELNDDDNTENNIVRVSETLEKALKDIDNDDNLTVDSKKQAKQELYNSFWNTSIYSTQKDILALQKSYTAKMYERYYFYWFKYDITNTKGKNIKEELLENRLDKVIETLREMGQEPTFEAVNDKKKEILSYVYLSQEENDIGTEYFYNTEASGKNWYTVKACPYDTGADNNVANDEGYTLSTKLKHAWTDNQYKVMILDQDGKVVYTSNPAYFERKGAIADLQTKQQNLTFTFMDDGYNGVYNIYGNDNRNNGFLSPQLKVQFNDSTQAVTNASMQIEWSFSKYNSMISPPSGYKDASGWDDSDSRYYKFKQEVTNIAMAYLAYQPKIQYNSSWTENTITCKVTIENTTISDSINLIFGHTQTSGTGWTLNIRPEKPYLNSLEPLNLGFELYNPQGVRVENFEGLTPEWSWWQQSKYANSYLSMQSWFDGNDQTLGNNKIDGNGNIIYEKKEDGSNDTTNPIKVKVLPTETISITKKDISFEPNNTQYYDAIVALKIKVNSNDNEVYLQALWPVAISLTDGIYSSAQAPNRIVYNQFNTSPSYGDNKELGLIKIEDGTFINPEIVSIIPEDRKNFYAQKGSLNDNKNIWQLHVPQSWGDETIRTIHFYDKEYGLVWIQPVIITSNIFGFEFINQWSGDKVEIGEEYLATPILGTGSKNNNNKFTGIIMGELSSITGTPNKNGLFGYMDDINTFSLNSDGSFKFGIDNSENKGYFSFSPSNKTMKIVTNNFDLQVGTVGATNSILITSEKGKNANITNPRNNNNNIPFSDIAFSVGNTFVTSPSCVKIGGWFFDNNKMYSILNYDGKIDWFASIGFNLDIQMQNSFSKPVLWIGTQPYEKENEIISQPPNSLNACAFGVDLNGRIINHGGVILSYDPLFENGLQPRSYLQIGIDGIDLKTGTGNNSIGIWNSERTDGIPSNRQAIEIKSNPDILIQASNNLYIDVNNIMLKIKIDNVTTYKSIGHYIKWVITGTWPT